MKRFFLNVFLLTFCALALGQYGMTATQAKRLFAPKSAQAITGPRLVVYGDSITAYGLTSNTTPPSSGAQQREGVSYAALAGCLAGDRVRLVHNAGNPGDRTDQILARWATDVAPYSPDVVLLLAGTNDVRQYGTLTLAQTKANIRAIVQKCVSINAVPILQTIPPAYTATAAANTELLQLNAWIRAYAASNQLPFVDQYAALVDPITGRMTTQYSIAEGGTVTGGTFTVTFNSPFAWGSGSYIANPINAANVSVTSGAIAYNATAATVQTAINGLSGLDAHQFTVTGAAGGPYLIREASGFPMVATVTSSLTGTAPTLTLTNGTQYCWDGIHPSITGQIVMAKAVAAMIQSLYPKAPLFLAMVSDNAGAFYPNLSDPGNFMRNGAFTAENNPGNGSYWSPDSVHFTISESPSTDGLGNWLSAVSLGTNGTPLNQTPSVNTGANDPTKINTGDTVALVGRVRISGCQPASVTYSTNVPTYSIYLKDSNAVVYAPIFSWAYDISDGWFYMEVKIPAGVTTMQVVVFQATGSTPLTIQVSQVALIDLTTLGLVSP